jgi:hypothetical protein
MKVDKLQDGHGIVWRKLYATTPQRSRDQVRGLVAVLGNGIEIRRTVFAYTLLLPRLLIGSNLVTELHAPKLGEVESIATATGQQNKTKNNRPTLFLLVTHSL